MSSVERSGRMEFGRSLNKFVIELMNRGTQGDGKVDGGIATKTLAQVYLNQGNPRKALEIYHEILKREPSNTEIREAIKTLKRKMAQPSQKHIIHRSQGLTKMEKIRNLEQWHENIRIIRKQRRNGKTH